MIITHLFLAFLISIGNPAQSGIKARTAAKQNNTTQKKAPLQLTLSLISKEYCAGDADLDALRINIKLRYTNLGNDALILYKGSNLISRLLISRNSEDAMAGRFEVNTSLTQVTDGAVKLETPTPSPLFAILPAGASFETETSLSVFVARDNKTRFAGAVSPGEHLLQIEVPTWPESNELATRSRKLWQRSGYLWYEPITSSPMSFTIEKERTLADCT